MKKMILLCSALSMIGRVSFVSGFSNVDLVKAADRLVQSCRFDSNNTTLAEPKLCVLLGDYMTTPQSLACTRGGIMHREHRKHSVFTGSNWVNHDNAVVNVMNNHLWYSPSLEDISKNEHHSGWGGITQPVAFAAADFSIKEGAQTLNKFDSVKSVTQSIPEQHRIFLYKNGKMVIASATAELARTAVEQGSAGMTSNNAKQFGKKALMHVASEGLEEYLVTPVSDYLLGEEDSGAKDLLHFGLTIAGFVALNAVAGGK